MDEQEVNVLIVGGGPHAFTCLLRLLEENPMPGWILDPNFKGHPKAVSKKTIHSAQRRTKGQQKRKKQLIKMIAVMDASSTLTGTGCGQWMRRWNDQFENLHIPYLRSPADVHPDPIDPQTLSMDAERKKLPILSTNNAITSGKGRPMSDNGSTPAVEMNLVEIDGLPKDHTHFHGPRYVPCTTYFKHFCEDLAVTYAVEKIVTPGCVRDVIPSTAPSGEKFFRVRYDLGQPNDASHTIRAKAVVLAIGHSNCPRIPDWALNCPSAHIEHVWELVCGKVAKPLREVGQERRGQTVVVVGGGLTSAYVVEAFVSEGVNVIHLVRNMLLAKPFDINMEWAGKKRALAIKRFLDIKHPRDRAEYNQNVRERGSLTHTAFARLRHLQETCDNYNLMEETTVIDAEECAQNVRLFLELGDVIDADWVCLCTGSALDIDMDPLLKNVRQHLPSDSVNGLPLLDSSMRWHPDWDMFVLGAYASLQLGPDALNLAGARRGAARVVPHLRKHLEASCAESEKDTTQIIGQS